MERKKTSKMIVPKYYMIPKYWERKACPDIIKIKEDEAKFLEKYRVRKNSSIKKINYVFILN